MRLLFISDIHGIIDHLEQIDFIIKEKQIDHFVVLGDLYASFFSSDHHKVDPSYVKSFLFKYRDMLSVMKGNCDSLKEVENSPFPIKEDVDLFQVDGLDLYFTHGDRYRYLKNDTFTDGILIYGHEHIPYIKREGDMIYINVGSVSLPRNELGPSYMIYEDRKFSIYSLLDGHLIDSIIVF